MAGFPFKPRFMTWLAAAVLCAGIACSGNGGDPLEDAVQDVTDDVAIDEDTVVDDDTLDRDVIDNDNASSDSIDPDVVDQDVLDLISLGKEQLSAGESLPALSTFGRALELAPDYPDALWGMVLARTQSMVSMWGSLLGLVNFRDDPDAEPIPVAQLPEFPEHPGTIGANIDSMYASAIEQKNRLDALKALGADTSFTLEGGLPLSIKDDLMMNLCCDWDISDLYGISSFNNLMLAFVSFLGSQDTEIVLQDIEDLNDELPGIEPLITTLLDLHPEFMKLLPDVGDDIWKSVKTYLIASADDALQASNMMTLGNDLENNVATLSDDEKPYLVLHGAFPDGATEMEFLWEGKTASLKAVVEKAKAHLEGAPDSRLSLDADVLIAIGVLVDIINRTVGIQTIVEGLGITLPDIVTGLMGSLDKTDPEQLVGLLGSLTSLLGIQNGSVEMDVGGFLDNPFNLRDMFPWHGPTPGSELKYFTRSFECVKGGMFILQVDSTSTLALEIMDPAATDASLLIDVGTYATPDGTGDPTDIETMELVPIDGFTGFFGLGLQLNAGTEGVQQDGVFTLPEGGYVKATYVSGADVSRVVNLGGTAADGLTPLDYAAACDDDTTPWDGPHFFEAEFADAYEVTAPGQTVGLPEVPADGKASRSGMMAFKSPSFDGLLWLKTGETFAPADQATLSGFIGGIMAALEAF